MGCGASSHNNLAADRVIRNVDAALNSQPSIHEIKQQENTKSLAASVMASGN